MKNLLLFCILLLSTLLFPQVIAKADSVIVEVENPTIITKIQEEIPDIKINRVYDTLFHGFSAELDSQSVDKLNKFQGVTRISKSVSYKVKLDESVPFIGGDAVRHMLGEDITSLTGKGVKVGVIDTGVDYTHPDLKENYHGGYDAVDEDGDPMETQKTQGEPTLHGTHVAGIIAANGKVKGVAPEAEIYGYRALGPGGFGTSEQVIAAIEKAVEDGMDVINLSLGNSVNGPDWPTSQALNKAVEKGVVAVTSAGNSGPKLWTVGSPGTASKAISVAASSPPLKIPFVQIGLEKEMIPIQALQGTTPWENYFSNHDIQMVDGGKGYPEEIQDASGKIVLIERGEIPFTEKALNAAEKGALAVLIYNNENGPFSGTLQQTLEIPVYSLTREHGLFMKEKIKSGANWLETNMKEMKDKIAAFSSRGPVTHTWDIKPDLSAPGVDIKSTIPDGYLPLQGTSMAAPHVAGAAALIKQAHPEWSPKQIKAALMNTSKLLKVNDQEEYLPSEQGAGRIQLLEAAKAETLIYPGSIPLGQFDQQEIRRKKQTTITIDNQGESNKKITFDYPKNKTGVQWELPHSFTIRPGEKKEVKIGFDIQPRSVEKGIHEGFLKVYSDGNPINLPYIYVIEEPAYPRVMGFDFMPEEKENTYKYEFYLPENADEVGIALYDPNSLQYKGMLFYEKDVKRGRFEKVLTKNELGFSEGIYKAVIFARSKGKEDYIERNILIGHDEIVLKEDQEVFK